MTLLVSWAGIDTHGVASAYIATDSRISWSKNNNFDHGRKVFAFRNSPDIIGYCGDVLFPSLVISQIVEMADNGLLFNTNSSCKERFEFIKEKIIYQFQQYPHMVEAITADTLQILHISRELNNKNFSCWQIKWQRKKGWSAENIFMPSASGILCTLGSGIREFNQNYQRYENSTEKNTSRSVFHCFCDTLLHIKDTSCGGAPQLAGIYRKPKSPGKSFGIIVDKKRYFLGAPINKDMNYNAVEWRNDLFERCDGLTLKRLDNAQKQDDFLRRSK